MESLNLSLNPQSFQHLRHYVLLKLSGAAQVKLCAIPLEASFQQAKSACLPSIGQLVAQASGRTDRTFGPIRWTFGPIRWTVRRSDGRTADRSAPEIGCADGRRSDSSIGRSVPLAVTQDLRAKLYFWIVFICSNLYGNFTLPANRISVERSVETNLAKPK